MASGWTEERKAQQRAAIQRWKPWRRSTGPRSPVGKARVARNAYRGGVRQEQREFARTFRAVLEKHTNVLESLR